MMWLILILVVVVAVAAYPLLKLVRLLRGDADLVVLSKKMKPEYFKGKVIWVTGASSGIGEEMCYQLSKFGAKLILSARNEQKLEQVKNNLASPKDARILPVDLSNPEATRAATNKAKDLFGKINILINNAGLATHAKFTETNEDVHRKVMEVDFFAPWILTQDCIGGMLEEGFGHIVNISSITAKCGVPFRSTYSAAKFAIHGLMDSIRYEMLEKGTVFITNVAPGPVCTDVSKNSLRGDGSLVGVTGELIKKGMPVKRCVELTLIGVSNQLNEVWISNHPILKLFYLAQYWPSRMYIAMCKLFYWELKRNKKAA